MALITQNTVLLAKEESTYGTDPTPTTAANAFYAYDVEIRPQSTVIERRPVSVTLSPENSLNSFKYYELSFTVEMKGSGAAGTAPRGVGDLLEACGMAETVVASTSVTYKPATSSLKSVTIYCYKDGLLYKLTGARGNVSVVLRAGETPKLQFSMMGRYNIPTDTSFPSSATYESTDPVVCSGLTMTYGSTLSPSAASIEINLNNDIGRLDAITGTDGIAGFFITNRNPTYTMETEAILRATTNGDLWADLGNYATRAFSAVVGSSAGNIATITAPAMSITNIGATDRNGISAYTITGGLGLSSGDDELSIALT